MPRYADIDELIKAAETVPYGNDIAIERFKSFVNQNAKVEDVAPVVHAHWETNKYGETRCSYCKQEMYSPCANAPYCNYLSQGEAVVPKHCAKCGAKMDEVIE